MASISRDPNGRRRILFVAADGRRKQIRLGKVTQRAAGSVKLKIESLVSVSLTGCSIDHETARWVGELDQPMVKKLANGGLRCPSEHLKLRWQDIDWQGGMMTVTSPKTKKKGKPKRLVPIFEELRPFLEDCFDQAESGVGFVVSQYRSPNGAYIRKRLDVMVDRAGLTRWPRITHNLRASRQTELERENPTHVVCAIMGNTPAVAHRHYVQVTNDDLLKTVGSSTQKAAQNPAARRRKRTLLEFQASRRNSRLCHRLQHSAGVCEGTVKTARREWMGIEPTSPPLGGDNGFEARGGHQIRVHSRNPSDEPH